MNVKQALARRFSRLATDVVVRRPALWRLFRGPIARLFGNLAPRWDEMRSPESFAPLERALAALDTAPRRVLDLGTGTGAAATIVARRFPEAQVVGVDLAQEMVETARGKLPSELAGRVTFQRADASSLPFEDGSFDLVTLANMIPFFDELTRVLAPGGTALFSFSVGADTPIYVPPDRLRRELEPRGFTQFAEFHAGNGMALLARKGVDA